MAVGEEDFGFDHDHVHSSLYFSYVVLVEAAVTVLVDLTSSRLLERGSGSRLPCLQRESDQKVLLTD